MALGEAVAVAEAETVGKAVAVGKAEGDRVCPLAGSGAGLCPPLGPAAFAGPRWGGGTTVRSQH